MKRVFSVLGTVFSIVLVIVIVALMIASATMLALSRTVLNHTFMLQGLRENAVYEGVCETVKTEAANAYRNSEFRSEQLDPIIDEVLNAAVRPEPLRKEVETLLEQLYTGQELRISGEYFIEDYSETIHGYLNEHGVAVPKESADGLIRTVADQVRDNVDLSEYYNQVRRLFGLATAAVVGILIGTFVLTVLLLLLFLFRKRKLKWMSFPFLIAGAILVLFAGIVLLLPWTADVILHPAITGFLFGIVRRILLILLIVGAVRLAIGVVLCILGCRKRKTAE